jgi:hypothetical protein
MVPHVNPGTAQAGHLNAAHVKLILALQMALEACKVLVDIDDDELSAWTGRWAAGSA